jgi:hypothetical protein
MVYDIHVSILIQEKSRSIIENREFLQNNAHLKGGNTKFVFQNSAIMTIFKFELNVSALFPAIVRHYM